MAERDDLTDVLRRRVLRALSAGTLRDGERLPSARELEGEFETDHRVILAAYRKLAEEGLVELRPRGGIYVRSSAGAEQGIPTPSVAWLVDVLTQGVSREVPISELHEWIRRSVETLRLRAVAIEATADQIAGLCRELRDDYGLDACGVDVAELTGGEVPLDVRRADLLVTTRSQATIVKRIGEQLGKRVIVATVRPDLVDGEWRLLLRKPVYVVVRDERYVEVLTRFFASVPSSEQMHILVLGRDDLSTIPSGAPTYITRSARDVLGTARIAGRIIPAARLFSTDSAREIIEFIVRANLEAITARRS